MTATDQLYVQFNRAQFLMLQKIVHAFCFYSSKQYARRASLSGTTLRTLNSTLVGQLADKMVAPTAGVPDIKLSVETDSIRVDFSSAQYSLATRAIKFLRNSSSILGMKVYLNVEQISKQESNFQLAEQLTNKMEIIAIKTRPPRKSHIKRIEVKP